MKTNFSVLFGWISCYSSAIARKPPIFSTRYILDVINPPELISLSYQTLSVRYYELSSLCTSRAQTKLQFCIYKSWLCILKNWLLSKCLMIKILLFFEVRIYKELFLKQNSVMSVAWFDREIYANISPGSINIRISTAKSRSLVKTQARSEASSLIRKLTSTENRHIVLKNFCVWLEGLERGWILLLT